jgi:hypothetical protein
MRELHSTAKIYRLCLHITVTPLKALQNKECSQYSKIPKLFSQPQEPQLIFRICKPKPFTINL